jgi:hypothetical protein
VRRQTSLEAALRHPKAASHRCRIKPLGRSYPARNNRAADVDALAKISWVPKQIFPLPRPNGKEWIERDHLRKFTVAESSIPRDRDGMAGLSRAFEN